ncbi:MAG: hypothetical protein FWE87_05415 [Coriobacteriia bacterium]|nr:hypothetical protein [Coriobacteriia bacterium]
MASVAVFMGLCTILQALFPNSISVGKFFVFSIISGGYAVLSGNKYPKRFGIIGVGLAIIGVFILIIFQVFRIGLLNLV